MPKYSSKSTASEVATVLKDNIRGKNGKPLISRGASNNANFALYLVLITGVSPSSLGEETVRVLAPYANLIIAASRNRARQVQLPSVPCSSG